MNSEYLANQNQPLFWQILIINLPDIKSLLSTEELNKCSNKKLFPG